MLACLLLPRLNVPMPLGADQHAITSFVPERLDRAIVPALFLIEDLHTVAMVRGCTRRGVVDAAEELFTKPQHEDEHHRRRHR